MGILARLTRTKEDPQQNRIPWTPKTTAGVYINEDNALTVGAVWGCITYISEAIAGMPWRVLREIPEGNEYAPGHPVDKLLYVRPNLETSDFQFKETLIHWALRHGNGYAEIERDQIGRPYALHLIHPDKVQPKRYDDGTLYYEVNNGTNGTVDLDAMDCLHIRGFGDDAVGVNVIQYAAQSIGWARAAQLFGAAFFGNGANVSLVVKNKIAMSQEALALQKAEFASLYGGPRNAHKTAHVDAETDVTPITTKFVDAQFVELQRHLVEEICRFFRVPPHIVAELSRSTNNNIEHQAIEAVQRCLTPWVKRLECEADYKLFGPNNRRGYFTKLNMASLLRGSFKEQAEGFKLYREMGVMSADEIRNRIDLNKIGGAVGDMRTMNGSYAPLERIFDGTARQAAVAPGQPAPQAPEPDTEDDDVAAMLAKLRVAGVPVKEKEEAGN